MPLEILQESNDDLVIKLLGIQHLNVFYDQLAFVKNEYSDLVVKPTSVTVTLAESVYGETEPTEDQLLAVRTWVAQKTGVDVNYVEFV